MDIRFVRRAAMEERLPQRNRYGQSMTDVPVMRPAQNVVIPPSGELDINEPAWSRMQPRTRYHAPSPAPQRAINISPATDIRAARRRGAILGDQRARLELMRLLAQ
jgi:hypothetical protein